MTEERKPAKTKEEKPKQKPSPKKKAISKAERARIRAEEIREKMAAQRSIQPGEVINGDPDLYVYYHVSPGMASTDRLIATMDRYGYEKCVDGEKMIGMSAGDLYRCPKEIADERARERKARLDRKME